MADQFVGEIRMFGGNFAPSGWATCDGQLLPISQNTALFSLLGTYYGGNGVSTFALPDLRGRTPIDYGNGTGLTPRSPGESGGADAVQLLEQHVPSHTHLAVGQDSLGTRTYPSGVWAEVRGAVYGPATNTAMAPGTLAPEGLSQPHNNLAPYLVLTFIIALQGIFPPRQ